MCNTALADNSETARLTPAACSREVVLVSQSRDECRASRVDSAGPRRSAIVVTCSVSTSAEKSSTSPKPERPVTGGYRLPRLVRRRRDASAAGLLDLRETMSPTAPCAGTDCASPPEPQPLRHGLLRCTVPRTCGPDVALQETNTADAFRGGSRSSCSSASVMRPPSSASTSTIGVGIVARHPLRDEQLSNLCSGSANHSGVKHVSRFSWRRRHARPPASTRVRAADAGRAATSADVQIKREALDHVPAR